MAPGGPSCFALTHGMKHQFVVVVFSSGFIPGPRSYLTDFQNVFVMACGTNFYSQCVPSNTVHLGFSASSAHWLSKKPCDITETLHHSMIVDQNEEKQKFSEQAEKDWELFLLNRAEEMAPGKVIARNTMYNMA